SIGLVTAGRSGGALTGTGSRSGSRRRHARGGSRSSPRGKAGGSRSGSHKRQRGAGQSQRIQIADQFLIALITMFGIFLDHLADDQIESFGDGRIVLFATVERPSHF